MSSVAEPPSHRDAACAHVVLVRGQQGDRELVARALARVGLELGVSEPAPGRAAAAWIREVAAGRPALAITGPGCDAEAAAAVVRELRSDPGLVGVPVLAFGRFCTAAAVTELLGAGASSVITASPFVDLQLRSLCDALRYWTHVAVLPPVPADSLQPGAAEVRRETRGRVARR